MLELWLKFKDPNGDERRIAVDKEKFAIGRHSENDLSVADGRLSREHVLIERYGDVFVVSDRNSSNGTEINGERLSRPTALKEGDRLSLGGLDVETEFVSDAPPPQVKPEPPAPETAAKPTVQTAPQAATGTIPTSIFIIAPIMAVLMIGTVGLLLYLNSGTAQNGDSNVVYSDDLDDTPSNRKKNVDPDQPPSGQNSSTPANQPITNAGNSSTPTPTGSPTDTAKTERNAADFLRHAAANDPKAFITGQQAQVLNTKIKSVAASPALADNINSARRSSAQLKTLAQAKNLKPQMLAAAAITKLGPSRGDVLQTAQTMADTLDKLGVQVGNELGDDCLLMMAAYDQGAAGDFLKMRNMLQDLATKLPESSRAIRSIWFLKNNNKITDAQFDLALRFLAVGTIMQNPGDYGVKVEALSL